MAKTVDEFSTLEDFRLKYNELATDVGDISGIVTDRRTTIVDAINSIEEKTFFFQEFIFTATTNQTSFQGNDDFDNQLRFRRNRIQVFVDNDHILEDDDYTIASPVASSHTEIQLVGPYAAGLAAGQKLTVYSFTGSFIGTEIQEALIGYFSENEAEAIYNTNDQGVILNATSLNATTVLTYPDVVDGEYKIEFAGNTYTQGTSLQDGAAEFNNTLGVDGNFRVGTGDTSLFDVDAATGNTQIDGTLEVDSTAGIDGNFRVGSGGTSLFDVDAATGNTQIDGTLEVDGTAGVDGNFRVGSGGTSLFDVDAATGNTQIDGTLEVDGTAGVDGNFRVGTGGTSTFDVDAATGNTQIDGTLGVDGESTLASATVSDLTENRITIAGTSGALEDDANLTFDGTNFQVGGTNFSVAQSTGNTSIAGTLEVDSTAGVDGNFRVGSGGNSYFDVAAASGNTTIDGTLNVAGLASLDGGIDVDAAFTVADSTGNINTTGTLTVSGLTSLNGGLQMDTDKFVVADDTGITTIAGTLDVAGLASLDGGIDVDGAFTVADSTGNISTSGTLTITGLTTLNGGLVMDTDKFSVANDTGDTLIAGTLGVTGQITGNVTGNVTGDLTGDVYASNGSSKILEAGTDGTDASLTGQVSDISNHSISGLSDVNSNPTSEQAGYLLTWNGTSWGGATPPEDGVLSLSSSNGIVDNGTAGAPSIELDYEIVSSAPTGVGDTNTGHLWFVV